MFVNELKEAFSRLVARESHNLLAITRKTGVNNSTLNRLNAKKASFENIPAKTIERLFPRMVVYFFPEDAPRGNVNVSGTIASGHSARAIVAIDSGGRIPPPDVDGSETINLSELEFLILHAEKLTAEEQIKFLRFLKDLER